MAFILQPGRNGRVKSKMHVPPGLISFYQKNKKWLSWKLHIGNFYLCVFGQTGAVATPASQESGKGHVLKETHRREHNCKSDGEKDGDTGDREANQECLPHHCLKQPE